MPIVPDGIQCNNSSQYKRENKKFFNKITINLFNSKQIDYYYDNPGDQC